MKSISLPIALRAYAVPFPEPKKREKKKVKRTTNPDFVLVVEVAVSAEISQKLTFGSYRVFEGRSLIDQGFFYADDLPKKQVKALRQYCLKDNKKMLANDVELRCLSRHQFLKEVFYRVGFEVRGAIVGFDLPFVISRLAEGWSLGRGFYKGGFNFTLRTYENEYGEQHSDSFAPRISIKSIDSKRAFIAFTSVRESVRAKLNNFPDYRCQFIDARTMSYALSGEHYDLSEACSAFGIPNIDRENENEFSDCYRRVAQISKLHFELIREFDRHPINLAPSLAFSPASLGKAYFRQMGIDIALKIDPKLKMSGDEILGKAMVAYYGGRTETRITKVAVPVVYLDFLSMYPTVNALMGIWDFLIAKNVKVEDATDEVNQLLESFDSRALFDPATWKALTVLVEVLPDEDLLPMRARFSNAPGTAFTNAVNYLNSDTPLWYALADVLACVCITGKAPKVLRAIKFEPDGIREDLIPTKLRGEFDCDPYSNDFFKVIVEARHQVTGADDEADRKVRFLKTLVNSLYGIFIELNRQNDDSVTVKVNGIESFETVVDHPEEQGKFFFPPIATFTTAAARLMLALVEKELTKKGGIYAYMDTDSIAVVSTQVGGLIPVPVGKERLDGGTEAVRAISWFEMETICRKFARLNPYNREIITGSILRLEDENFRMEGDPLRRPPAVALLRHFVKKICAFQSNFRRIASKKI